jgi:hypothetical protein
MPFKTSRSSSIATDSPESLFLDLRTRKYPGLLTHQGDVLREYRNKAVADPDVAFQLPTGSGKTLVGLLIGEWRRRKFDERVVYLCPTNQLVNQVAGQARRKYGLRVNAFTGKKTDYDPAAKAEYLSGESIAVTSYSGLFNVNPFFDDPNLIILDDAHATENYIASHWSLHVERHKHGALFSALTALLRGVVPPIDHQKLTGAGVGVWDRTWVDKIPTPMLYPLLEELVSTIDAHVGGSDLRFRWNLLRDHLPACHLYVGAHDMLIRPLIPPTNTHAPFANAKQRVYMSATLGEGGDLERLTGRNKITRLKLPAGWERQSIGRRLFFFPGSSLSHDESQSLVLEMMKTAGRSMVIVPDDKAAEGVREVVRDRIGFNTFDAEQIESSKEPFVSSPRAVAVVANRYDGIDFPHDECRLLIVEGVPRGTNLQERFIIYRIGAVALLNDRILTRVQQAFGRCTRAATDFAAVVVSGEELSSYLMKRERRQFLHPELQAELQFGLNQSKEMTAADLLDNLGIFFTQSEEWSQADNEIVVLREKAQQTGLPGAQDLQNAAPFELDYQYAMWRGDYAAALAACRKILAELKDSELRGYRALWSYLAGSAAWLAEREGVGPLVGTARDYYEQAMGATQGARWLIGLSRIRTGDSQPTAATTGYSSSAVYNLIERLEIGLDHLGMMNDQKYAQEEAFILKNLEESEHIKFEEAVVRLGRLLGFDSGNKETRGAPDPWWIIDENQCLIFEVHSKAKAESSLDVTKARQASTHPNWVRANLPVSQTAEILPVLISPVKVADTDALPHLGEVSLWNIEDFRAWAKKAVGLIRELRRTYPGSGDLAWREEAARRYVDDVIAPATLFEWLRSQSALTLLTPFALK